MLVCSLLSCWRCCIGIFLKYSILGNAPLLKFSLLSLPYPAILWFLYYFCLIMSARVSFTAARNWWSVLLKSSAISNNENIWSVSSFTPNGVLSARCRYLAYSRASTSLQQTAFVFHNFNTGVGAFSCHWPAASNVLTPGLICCSGELATCLSFIWFLWKYVVGRVKPILGIFISQQAKY